MKQTCRKAVESGIEYVAFGDLFLADIREYREKQLQDTGLQPVFPVWGIPTSELAQEMIGSGLRARLACIDTKQISGDFAGREFDAQLLSELPASADPCGENGEFHSFVYAGPMFSKPVPVEVGEVVMREQFAYADLRPSAMESTGGSLQPLASCRR
jgi:diphthamide synthase (EF-2-diphthine--ammonia ligase)